MGTSTITTCIECRDSLTAPLRKPSMRYLDEFLRLRCAPDLLAWGLFPNSKEITESLAAYEAVRQYLWPSWLPDDPRIEVFCVGDGATPRTAATFALRSKWQVHSVDPRLRRESEQLPIDRLWVNRCKVEDLVVANRPARSIIVAVHSHADLHRAYMACRGAEETAVIAMKCCVPQNLGVPPDEIYEDFGVWSPHRTVQVWRSI